MPAPSATLTAGAGTITSTGEANGFLVTIDPFAQNPRLAVGVAGTFTGATLAVRGRLLGLTNYFPLPGKNRGANSLVADSSSIGLTDSTNASFEFDISGCDRVEIYCPAGTLTAFGVEARQYAADAPVLNVVNLSVTGAQSLSSNLSVTGTIAGTSSILSTGATGGVGYATGAGGTVTQATSRTTGVTLNKVTGNIVLVSAAGSATPFSFPLTNSTIAAGDTVVVSQKSGTDKYTTQVVTAVGAGSCQITLANASGTTTEQPVFNFVVIKGVAA